MANKRIYKSTYLHTYILSGGELRCALEQRRVWILLQLTVTVTMAADALLKKF